MGIGSANPLLLASAASGGDSDPVTRSLRFDGGESLSRTFGSTGDSKKFTFACWVKRTELGGNQRIFQASNSNNDDFLRFNNDNTLGYWIYQNGSHNHQGNTTAVFRDVSAWMHVCYVVDTAQATAANRVKIFVNGVSHTLSVYPDQNRDCSVMNTAALHYIGRYGNSASEYANLYIADAYFLDGEAVEPVGNFIESNDYGSYIPKAYTGSFGTNGFHLKLDDSSDIGADDAGSNDFTANNLSSHDVMLDTPTKNYATLNSLDAKGSAGSDTFREGNLDVEFSNIRSHAGTVAATGSGKYYAEVYYKSGGGSNRIGVGVVSLEDRVKDNTGYSVGTSSTNEGGAIAVFGYAGQVFNNLGSTPTNANYLAQNAPSYAAIAAGDIVQIALDLDAGTVKFGLNGDWYNNTSTSTFASAQTVSLDKTKIWTWFFGGQDSSSTERAILNAGQDPTFANNKTSGQDTSQSEFFYAPPTGFKSLNTSNLAAPTVTPSEHFNTVLYSGTYDGYNGTGTDSQSITGVGFSPSIVWVKDRDGQSDAYGNAYSAHYWFDAVLGAGAPVNIDAGQGISGSLNSGANGVDTFDSDGFSVDSADETNYSADTGDDFEPDTPERYVAWCWKLGTTASSWSGSGQDPDSEQYNSDAGMSVINYYDGDYAGTSITFNHSLGAAPEFAMALDYEGYHGANYAWHKDLSSGNYLDLSSTGSQTSDSTYFPSSPATNTTFEMGVSLVDGIQSHVALFRSVEGFSKFGSYKGVGSNGVYVYTGHRPKMIWIKNKTGTGNWFIFDAVRDTYNEAVNYLRPNSYGTETTNSGYKLDILSNGFRINVESSHMNNSSYEYIFCSFAEQPFAAPSNAR